MCKLVLSAVTDLSFVSGDWWLIRVDDAAGQLVHSSVTALRALVRSLLQGDVLRGNLQTCLQHKDQFKQLYQQCMRRSVVDDLPS